MISQQKGLKTGDRVRLTGIGNISLLGHLDSEEINEMVFPIETEVFYRAGNPTALCLGSQKWAVDWFTYEIIEPKTKSPNPKKPVVLPVGYDTLLELAADAGVETITGPFPNTIQVGFHLTNGKPFLIVWAVVPLVNVTVHDDKAEHVNVTVIDPLNPNTEYDKVYFQNL